MVVTNQQDQLLYVIISQLRNHFDSVGLKIPTELYGNVFNQITYF